MNVQFIEKANEGSAKNFETVNEGDVVILPAFGASYEEMDYFDKKNVQIVDTTCPWVSKVWNTVDMHQKKGLTSIIHGKYAHEETVATASFCEDYIIVKDMKEAEMVTDYILNNENAMDKQAFMKYFENAISQGFDPDVHLKKVGLANQTTMYKKETRAIGQMFQKAMMKKYGPQEVQSHYMEFDTICDATQVRTMFVLYSFLLVFVFINVSVVFVSLSDPAILLINSTISTNAQNTHYTTQPNYALHNTITLHRNDKTPFTNWWKMPRTSTSISSSSSEDGTRPIRLTCWKFPSTPVSVPFTLIRLPVLVLIIPLLIAMSREKWLRNHS